MILSIAASAVLMVALVGILTYKWVDVPLLTKIQTKDQPMEGVVDSIATLPGGVIEIGLKQGGTIDPSLQEGPMVMTSCSITSFAHFRPGQALPEKGIMVKAETTNRLYHLRERSLNWVRSWVPVDSVKPGMTITAA